MEAIKFEAITMKDAIKKIKEELGKDAVIISSREKEKVLTVGGKPTKIIEVFATPSAINQKQAADQQSSKNEKKIYKPNFPRIETREKATIVSNSTRPQSRNAPVSSSAMPILSQATEKRQVSRAPTTAAQQVAGTLHADPGHVSEIQKQLQVQIESLKGELKSLPQVNLGEQVQEIKVLLHDIIRSQTTREKAGTAHPEIENICIKLRSAGVTASVIADLNKCLESEVLPQGAHAQEFYLSAAIKYMLRAIKVVGAFADTGADQEIHCLVGPTGVGKTTSIAKIAAQLKIRKNKSVALISMDSVRVSAAEQLRVYGKILDVPFQEIRDIQDLTKFVTKRYDIDAILIDTAGRPAQSAEQIDFLRMLKGSAVPVKFHLVLSSMMKQRDLEETVRAYQFLNPASIIFTKLDESWSFGEIFNICALFKIPLSYFAVGQRVPEDLETATKERVIERILRI